MTRITFHEHRYTLLIPRTDLLKMRNVCEIAVHKIETNFMYGNIFKKNCAYSEKMCKNMVQPERETEQIKIS
jgi:hypothetical protein